MAAVGLTHNTGNRSDVGVNIAERTWSKTEKLRARLEDLGYGFHLVGNRCDHQIRLCGANLLRICGPGILDDGNATFLYRRTHLRAVLRACDDAIENAKTIER